MGGDGAGDKDWPRVRGHHLCLTDTILQVFRGGRVSRATWPFTLREH